PRARPLHVDLWSEPDRRVRPRSGREHRHGAARAWTCGDDRRGQCRAPPTGDRALHAALDEVLRGDHRQLLGAVDLVRTEERRAGPRALAVAGAVRGVDVARDEVAVHEATGFGLVDPP